MFRVLSLALLLGLPAVAEEPTVIAQDLGSGAPHVGGIAFIPAAPAGCTDPTADFFSDWEGTGAESWGDNTGTLDFECDTAGPCPIFDADSVSHPTGYTYACTDTTPATIGTGDEYWVTFAIEFDSANAASVPYFAGWDGGAYAGFSVRRLGGPTNLIIECWPSGTDSGTVTVATDTTYYISIHCDSTTANICEMWVDTSPDQYFVGAADVSCAEVDGDTFGDFCMEFDGIGYADNFGVGEAGEPCSGGWIQ